MNSPLNRRKWEPYVWLLPSILLKEHKARYIETLVENQEGEDSRVLVEFVMGK